LPRLKVAEIGVLVHFEAALEVDGAVDFVD
jgi:hypothetical protein